MILTDLMEIKMELVVSHSKLNPKDFLNMMIKSGLAEKMVHYGDLRHDLIKLLGDEIANSSPPIKESITKIIELQNNQKEWTSIIELSKMKLFAHHLKLISKYDDKNNTQILNSFKKLLKKITDRNRYYGLRYEVDVAATLIHYNCNFKKRESPDFEVFEDEKTVFIECTSSHVEEIGTRDLESKLKSTISTKSEKPYCNLQTALSIDITNLLHNEKVQSRDISIPNIRLIVESILEDDGFGSIILYFYVGDKNDSSFQAKFERIDNTKIDATLQKVLDKLFSKATLDSIYTTTPYG